MNVVILQPSYIPWRGYFHQIQKADIFVFYDCVQYDKHGWRNRNKIKTSQGPSWLTIPVNAKGNVSGSRAIQDIPIVWDTRWSDKHLRAIRQSYSKAPFFAQYEQLLEDIYSRHDARLVDFTCSTTELIARRLGIEHTRFVRSSETPVEGNKTDRLISLLTHLGATRYISGPSAEAYIEKNKFDKAGISLEFMSYDYPEYPQINGPFAAQVTVLDLLFNVGPEAYRYIWK